MERAVPSDGEGLVRWPLLFLWAPALTILVGIPLAVMPFSGDPRGFWAPYTLIAAPFYLGIAAAPGYVLTLLRPPSWLHETPRRRFWVRGSLATALVCSIAGTLGGTLMVLFLPPALWTFVQTVVLWRRFERARRAG